MMRTVAQRLLLLASLLLLLATGLLPQSRVPSAQALAQHKNHHTFKLLAVDDDTQLAHATKCMTRPPDPAGGSFPWESHMPWSGSLHWGSKSCKGTPSGHSCIGTCHEHFSGAPSVRCWKGSWQPIQGGCTPDQGPSPPLSGPCGSSSDDYCADIFNAVNGSCTAVPPDSYKCQCMQGYKWNIETSSCLPALAIAVGIRKGRLVTAPRGDLQGWGPVILLWDGATWKRQWFPLHNKGLKLTSVAFINATTALVAGSYGTRGVLLRWDGNAWSGESIPFEPGSVDLGAETRVTSAPAISFAVTLASPYTSWLGHDSSELVSWFIRGNLTNHIGITKWTPLQTSGISCPAGDVIALSGVDSPVGFHVVAATTHQVLLCFDDGSLLDGAYTPYWREEAHVQESISTIAVGCCKLGEENPMVWFAAPASPLAPGDKLCQPNSIGSADCMFDARFGSGGIGNADPPFSSGFAFNHISGMPVKPGKIEGCASMLKLGTSSSTACAWAVGAGLPDNVGTIHGFVGNITVLHDPNYVTFTSLNTQWQLYLDGRLTKPKLPPLRGSHIWDRHSAIAVGDAGAVVWWDGKTWKVVQPLHGADDTIYDLKTVALYAPD